MEQIELPGESLGIKGHLAIIELPHDMSDEELADWLNPVTELGEDGLYHVIKPAKISEEERARRTALEAENLLTNAGIAQFLNNLMAPGQGLLQPFSQIFAVGNGAIAGVTRSDTAVAGDGFTTGTRKVPTGTGLVGLTTTLSMSYASGDAQGSWTNAGLFGFNVNTLQQASTTANTGQLNTHVLFNYVKGAVAIAVSYVISFSGVNG